MFVRAHEYTKYVNKRDDRTNIVVIQNNIFNTPGRQKTKGIAERSKAYTKRETVTPQKQAKSITKGESAPRNMIRMIHTMRACFHRDLLGF